MAQKNTTRPYLVVNLSPCLFFSAIVLQGLKAVDADVEV